jgi:hypothetical protein
MRVIKQLFTKLSNLLQQIMIGVISNRLEAMSLINYLNFMTTIMMKYFVLGMFNQPLTLKQLQKHLRLIMVKFHVLEHLHHQGYYCSSIKKKLPF